ncbi:hypothetical protein HJC10_02755 [Corallococcus exiguus]|uniref:hypothetical protein n=1 Tax=Corallococcus exiguus TaxID=83462 RepID=UPI001470E5EC|nr:hypothetical protein [Corallococcus exiguus]NNB92665.1 hypothetical protein [Corallococcus exiguus]NNC01774.1 hypothetical protein [Corallococcus exiguus]
MDSMEDFRERMLFFNLDRTGSRPPPDAGGAPGAAGRRAVREQDVPLKYNVETDVDGAPQGAV